MARQLLHRRPASSEKGITFIQASATSFWAKLHACVLSEEIRWNLQGCRKWEQCSSGQGWRRWEGNAISTEVSSRQEEGQRGCGRGAPNHRFLQQLESPAGITFRICPQSQNLDVELSITQTALCEARKTCRLTVVQYACTCLCRERSNFPMFNFP